MNTSTTALAARNRGPSGSRCSKGSRSTGSRNLSRVRPSSPSCAWAERGGTINARDRDRARNGGCAELGIDANTRLPEEHLCALRRKARRNHEPPWNVALRNDWQNPFNRVVWQLWSTVPELTMKKATRLIGRRTRGTRRWRRAATRSSRSSTRSACGRRNSPCRRACGLDSRLLPAKLPAQRPRQCRPQRGRICSAALSHLACAHVGAI